MPKDWKAECVALKRNVEDRDRTIRSLQEQISQRAARDSDMRDRFRELIIDLLDKGRD